MIGYLTGTIVHSDVTKSIVLTNSGIGYEVVTATPLVPNKDIALFISHIIREDSQTLYGFESVDEKKFFEMLIDVNGIGPKSAYGLISHLGVSQILSAITFENADVLKSAPGVGKKSAEQIILTLKDKIQKLDIGFSMSEKPQKKGAKQPKKNEMDPFVIKETLAACQGLGFKDQDILPLVQKLLQDNQKATSEELVKLILKELR
ncbi:MAG: Holliday junction branch migration protein RuvA [Bacteriovoracaceae bacterium]